MKTGPHMLWIHFFSSFYTYKSLISNFFHFHAIKILKQSLYVTRFGHPFLTFFSNHYIFRFDHTIFLFLCNYLEHSLNNATVEGEVRQSCRNDGKMYLSGTKCVRMSQFVCHNFGQGVKVTHYGHKFSFFRLYFFVI